MQTLDLLGALLALISAILYMQEKPSAWLLSLAATPIDAIMDFNINVYGDLILQGIYCTILLYGWYRWKNPNYSNESVSIRHISPNTIYNTCLLSGLLILISYSLLTYFSPSEISILDACVTSLSIVGMYLLSVKIVESWLLWVLIDALYIALFFKQSMPFHSLMCLFDGMICLAAFMAWRKELSQQPNDKSGLNACTLSPT